jgi:transcriptional antiterminator
LYEGFEEVESIAMVASECGVSIKTIHRDLTEIQEFLHTMS